jgi:nucleoside phosphorylase
MHLLVCFALKEEAAPFRKIAAGRPGVSILLTGIGKKNAERAVRDFLAGGANRPNLVLTCGFAGGLEPRLTHGEIVFSTDDSALRNRLLAAGAGEGKFFCADRIAVTAEEKWALWQKTGADAVEMESEIIRAVCREHGIPSATVRVISDIAGEDLPLDFNALAKPDQNLDFGKLAWAIAKSPGKIPALLRLQKQTAAAAKKLAQVLDRVTAA